MIEKAASWVVTHRRAVIVGLVVLAAAAAAGMPRLQADFTVDELFADAGDQRRVSAAFRQTYGNTDNTLLIVVRADKVLGPTQLAYVAELTEAAKAVPGVARLRSVANVPVLDARGSMQPSVTTTPLPAESARAVLEAAMASPVLSGRLVARRGSAALVVMQLEAAVASFDELAAVTERFESVLEAHPPPPQTTVALGGLPHIRVEVVGAMNRDQLRLLPIGFAICLLILLVSFRWLPALILPLVVVGIAALVVVGGMAWTGVSLNVVNNLVPLLIVIIGVSDSIHLISRHLEEHATSELADAERRRFAARRSTERVAVACLLTSVTTAIGFASLGVSGIGILRTFGAVAAAGVMVAFLVTVTFLPSVLSSVGAGGKRPRTLMAGLSLGRLARALFAHRVLVVVLFVALGAGALWVCRGLTVDEGVRRQFDEDSDIGRTMTVLEEEFAGLRPLELSLSSPSAGRFAEPEVAVALDELTTWAREHSITLSALSFATLLREARLAATFGASGREVPLSAGDPIAAYSALIGSQPELVTDERDRTRVSIGVADIGSAVILEFADDLRARAVKAFERWPDIDVAITGEGYASSLGLESLILDLARSLAIAIIGILVVLAIAFRSIRLGLIGLPSSALPIAFGLAYMTARGIPLGTATVIVFSVALGLAVDGTIHVIARFREELASGVEREAALVSAIDSSGRAVIATCLTLIAGFGILSLSSFVPVRHFGELIAICIVGTVVCQLVLLPPLLALFGRST